MKQFSKELGKVSITPKGDWNSSIANEKLDIVYDRRNNQAYIAKQDVPIGVDIDNREYWQPLNVSGYADNNFINLTAENENGTITAYESLEEAVATIFPINRRVGATLSFYNLNSDRLDRQAEFELWQFNSTDLANWENRNYWNNIYYNWNVFAGWYVGADALKNHVETPNVGQYAYVGSNLNDAILYQCRTNGTWTNTGIKVRNYISIVVSGNITIGENGNWFSNGEDTGIPATPSVDEQLDNIITKYESLSRTIQGIAVTGGASTAINVTYDNDNSRLNAENAQDAIDELNSSKIDKSSIAQELGTAEDKVMSQKATTNLLNSAIITGASYKFSSKSGTINVPLNNLKIGNSILVEDLVPSNLKIFLMYDNKQQFIAVKANEITKITRDDIEFLRLYVKDNQKVSAKITIFNNIIKTLHDDVANIKTDIEQNKTDISNIKDNEKTNTVLLNSAIVSGSSYTFSSDLRSMNIHLSNLKIGNSILVEDVSSNNVSIFLFYGEQSLQEYIYIKPNELTKITRDDIKFVRIYNNINDKISAKVSVFSNLIKDMHDDIASIKAHDKNLIDFRVLILGDSYSQNGGNWVKPMMSKFSKNSSYISLAVSSAIIKDRFKDRNTYPYTSKPNPSVNSGNLNTLACQIEKLERLMAGNDLLEGETKIYESKEEYPNVIIIEGGMNDTFDDEDKESTYFSQFEVKKDNVYTKQNSKSETKLGSVYIKPSLDEIDRTCFAGAYRYLVEKLLQKFPDAQIFFTTCSNLGYYSKSVIEKRYKTRIQQRKCADLCSATIIDWGRDGQINNIFNCPSGDGTEQNPYVWAENHNDTAYRDTGDLMHPNSRGGIKYGYLAASIIKNRFLEILK